MGEGNSSDTHIAANVLTVTPEQVPALLSEIVLRWKGTTIRDVADVIAPDGNHYTFHGDCEGCLKLRPRLRHLEEAVSELQDLFSDALTVLKSAGLIGGDDAEA